MDSEWAGVAVGALAAVPAYIGLGAVWMRAGVVEGQAQRAEERAEGALEAYQRMAESLDRLADIGSGKTTSGASGPQVSFVIEWRRGDLYTLRNLGPGTATGVTIDGTPLPIARDLPVQISLRPLEAHNFILSGAFGRPVPPQLLVTCNELGEPVLVPVAPKF